MSETKYNVGDKVIITSEPVDWSSSILPGTIGVICQAKDRMNRYGVSFPGFENRLHNCNGYAPKDNGQWINSAYFRSYSDDLKQEIELLLDLALNAGAFAFKI